MDVQPIIPKTAANLRVAPNFADYEGERCRFSWEAAAHELTVEPGGGLNIAWQAVDRHCTGPHGTKTALRFLARNAPARNISYAELAALTNRFCNVLRKLGVRKGDRLFILSGRIPELYVALLGALKNGTVVSPLFSAFGPEPIVTRVNLRPARRRRRERRGGGPARAAASRRRNHHGVGDEMPARGDRRRMLAQRERGLGHCHAHRRTGVLRTRRARCTRVRRGGADPLRAPYGRSRTAPARDDRRRRAQAPVVTCIAHPEHDT